MQRLTALGAALLIVLGIGFALGGGAASAQGLADVRLGNEAFRLGDYEAAVRHYTDAIRSGELVGEALAITYNNRGVAHGEAGDFDPAIADYSQAMALRPGDATTIRNLRVAHVRRGEVRFASGAYDDALADFTQAIELEPEHHLAYQRRGELYSELGRVDLAVGDLEQAMLLSPGDPEVAMALERATAQRERVASAPAPVDPGPGEPAPADPVPGDVAAADPATPEPPAAVEPPTAAAPSDTAQVPAPAPAQVPDEAGPAAEAPAVAAVPAPAPHEAPEPSAAPDATAEREADPAPVAPAPPAAELAPPAPPAAEPAAPAAPPADETTTAAAEGDPYRVISAVNYRAGPDNAAQRLGAVDAGEIVRVTGDTLGWKHVILPNGDRGYIYGSWLQPAGN